MIVLDSKKFARGNEAFLAHMKKMGENVPFKGFGHRFFVTDETAYKEETLAKARRILQPAKWPEWREKHSGRIVEKLREACQPAVAGNLLEHKFGHEQGSYGAIYKVAPEDVATFEGHCVQLFLASMAADVVVGEAVDAFADYLREKRLGCKWEFVAYLLFILKPERFFPIRSTHFERVLKFYGVDTKISGRVEWSRYKTILDVADAVKEKLAVFGLPTAIQVQSYMWVISYLLPLEDQESPPPDMSFAEELERRVQRDRQRQQIGIEGEQYVYESEKRRLKAAGREDLAERVSLVSAVNDSAGYDIGSFDVNGDEVHIEVKSTIRSEDNDSCFWLSDNEYQAAMNDPAWTLYRVWRVEDNPTHADLGNVATQDPPVWVPEIATWRLCRRSSRSSD